MVHEIVGLNQETIHVILEHGLQHTDRCRLDCQVAFQALHFFGYHQQHLLERQQRGLCDIASDVQVIFGFASKLRRRVAADTTSQARTILHFSYSVNVSEEEEEEEEEEFIISGN